tara:strand:- start:53 stop:649 length:597 start_codon:yes stop_codon:yes gene_type:complete
MQYPIYQNQEFSGHTMKTAERMLTEWGSRQLRTVIDCGAWIGQFALLCPEAQEVHCFEPNPETQPILRNNVARQDNVHLHYEALSNQAGTTSLRYDTHSGTCHMWSEGHADNIPVRTLDSYQFAHVDMIKIDVEGMELPLLKGAEHTIRKWRPWICIERNQTSRRYGRAKAEALQLLVSWGMRTRFKSWPDTVMDWQP